MLQNSLNRLHLHSSHQIPLKSYRDAARSRLHPPAPCGAFRPGQIVVNHDDEAQTESIEADTEDEPTAEQLAEMEAADEASAAEAPEADTGDEGGFGLTTPAISQWPMVVSLPMLCSCRRAKEPVGAAVFSPAVTPSMLNRPSFCRLGQLKLGCFAMAPSVLVPSSPKAAASGSKADEVKSAIAASVNDVKVDYALQEEQLGTGHAVKCAADFIGRDGDVIILCGDTPLVTGDTLRKALDFHKESGNGVTVISAMLDDPFGYGRIIRDGDSLAKIVEQKDADEAEQAVKEVNSGMYN